MLDFGELFSDYAFQTVHLVPDSVDELLGVDNHVIFDFRHQQGMLHSLQMPTNLV